jgi:FMN phosphatase YigB (HAD superfamily)
MKILVDFDRTVYDTDLLIADSLKLVERKGINPKEWQDSWSKSYNGSGVEAEQHYSIWKHLEKYKQTGEIDSEDFLREYAELIGLGSKYIFPDAVDFLKDMKMVGELILITYGDEKFQSWKIEGAGVGHLYDKIKMVPKLKIVPKRKAGNISELISGDERAVFVDDWAEEIDEMKEYHPQVVSVHIRRPGTKHSAEDSKLADFEAQDLKEAGQIILDMTKDD